MTASDNPGHGTKGDIKGRESRLGATKSPRFPTLDGRPRRPILPFWQLSPHLTNPWCPDAGGSEGTRLGEGSREFVLEGHRVSYLVPTSGGSEQGVNFGVFGANISLG